MKKALKRIKLFGSIAVIIIVCTFILQLPIYAPFLVILVVMPLLYYNSTIAVIGNYLYMKEDFGRSKKALGLAIKLKTSSPAAYLNYGVLLMKEDRKNAEAALKYLKKSEEINVQILLGKNICVAMGSCYWLLGDIDKAIEVLEGMRKKYDYVNGRVLTTLGYMYFLKDDYDTAMEISQDAIKDSPDLAAAWDNVGQIYLKQGELAKAKEALTKAIDLKSDLPDSLYYLGIVSELENDIPLALEYIERAANCKIGGLNTVTREMIDKKRACLKTV